MASDQLVEHLTEIEEVADEIISDKHELIELDKKRQKTREAVRCLRKDKTTKKHWVCFGNMFLKIPAPKASQLLQKDFDELDKEINAIRTKLKPKVSKLRDLQHEDDIKGFHLSPLNKEDLASVEDYL